LTTIYAKNNSLFLIVGLNIVNENIYLRICAMSHDVQKRLKA